MDTFNTKAARAMRSAFEAGKKGVLLSETDDAKRLVFFENGELVGAKSDQVDERLGSVMVRRQRITEAELDHAMSFIRSGRRLGQILVELGYLKGGEIERFVRFQIIDIACSILMVSSKRLVFSEQMEVEAVTLSPVSIGDVFLEAVHRLPSIGIYRENVLIDEYVLEQTDDALAVASGMELSTEQAHVLDLVDGASSVHEIIEASPLDEETTVRVLIALHQSGVVTLKERKVSPERPPGPRPTPDAATPDPFEKELIATYNDVQCQNHWQVLGLSRRSASYEEIDAAYRERFHKLDPEKWQHIPDSDFQEKLSFVRARIKEAYVTLSSQSSTNVYEKLDDHETQYQETKQQWDVIESEAKVAEAHAPVVDPDEGPRLFKRAKLAYKEKDFWSAIKLCRTAIELDDNNDPERYHLLGRALSENPRWRHDAEQNLKIANKLAPWEPRYLVSLARLYQKEGLTERAERVIDQVRTLDPDFPIPDMSDEKRDGTSKRKADKNQKAG